MFVFHFGKSLPGASCASLTQINRAARIAIRGWTCTARGRLIGEGRAYLDAIVDQTA